MNVQLNVLRALLDPELYNIYKSHIKYEFIKENYPEIYRLYKSLDSLQTNQLAFPFTIDDLELEFYKLYPNSDRDHYKPLLEQLRASNANHLTIIGHLETARKRAVATELARVALDYAQGRGTPQDIEIAHSSIMSSVEEPSDTTTNDDNFITDSLSELTRDRKASTGFRWRLRSLNESLGSLRKGDFGFIFARPETGKTTFLASECTYMAGQVQSQITEGTPGGTTGDGPQGPILWFNNEEAGKRVMHRCIQAALGLTIEQMALDIPGNEEKYHSLVNHNLKIYDSASMTRNNIDVICRNFKPSMIIFDQIDKIQGFLADRYDLQMKAIYQWARELSKTYGPVIGVCQAGGTGDGKKFLTMNDVDSSHTAKQGEADWMLGIGKTYEHGSEEIRYLHLCKNKLQGDLDTNPDMRHGKWEVLIKPETARYADY